jgi:Carbohydrate-binding module 48 (Isoamylase N-terminal domain)
VSDIEPKQDLWIDDVASELQRPVRLSLSFDRRVMAAIRTVGTSMAHADERNGPGWRWSVTLTPLRAMAVAAGLAFMTLGSGWLFSRGFRPTPAGSVASSPVARIDRTARAVQFVVVAPSAGNVTLVGDFNDWSSTATPMHRASVGGLWSVTVPLPAGRYQYAFVINGREWRADPGAPAAPVDDFGAPNSIVAVTDRAS